MTRKFKTSTPTTAKTPLPVADWPQADRTAWLKAVPHDEVPASRATP